MEAPELSLIEPITVAGGGGEQADGPGLCCGHSWDWWALNLAFWSLPVERLAH